MGVFIISSIFLFWVQQENQRKEKERK